MSQPGSPIGHSCTYLQSRFAHDTRTRLLYQRLVKLVIQADAQNGISSAGALVSYAAIAATSSVSSSALTVATASNARRHVHRARMGLSSRLPSPLLH